MILRCLPALLACCFIWSAPAVAADAGRGADLAGACVACHGEAGNSTTENVPSLAGHPESYLTIQLILFREQQRKNEIMTPLAGGLSDTDIEDLAAHFSSQRRARRTEPTDPAAASGGREIAAANNCGSCHLPDYSGREQIPRLAAQRPDYLLKTMRDYKAGTRSGLDGMMTGVLHGLGDDHLAALAAYLGGLN